MVSKPRSLASRAPNLLTGVCLGMGLGLLSGVAVAQERAPGAATVDHAMPLPSAPIRLITGPDYPPYSGSELPEGGLMTALVTRAFAKVGVTHQPVVFKPWARGLAETAAIDFDATFPYTRNPEREAQFLYSAPVLEVEEAFFARQDFPARILTPPALQDRRVCRPVGYSLMTLQALQSSVPFEIESPESMSQCFSMLGRGRVDLVFTSEWVGRYTLRNQPEPRYKVLDMPDRIGKVGLHLVVSRNHPEAAALRDAFDRGLEQLRQTGEFEQTVAEYLGDGRVAHDRKPVVLIVHSYGPDLTWVQHQSTGLRRTLGEAYRYHEVYLETRRLPESEYRQRVEAALVAVQREQPLLTFITDDNALRLLGPALGASGWVVFGGINGAIRTDFPWAIERPNVAGVLERPLIARSITQIQQALGRQSSRVLVLAGEDETTRGMLQQEFGEQRQIQLPESIALTIAQSGHLADWRQILREKADEFDFLLVMGNQALKDEAGRQQHELEVARLVSTIAPRPVFTIHEQQIGEGLFAGGMVVSGLLMGEDMATLAQQILRENRVPSMMEGRFIEQSEGLMIFSRAELARWGLALEGRAQRSAFLVD